MALTFSLLAAACFAAGGLFMKQADGFRHLGPGVAFLGLFLAGGVLQSLAMRGEAMVVTYVVVLALEAAFAVALAMVFLGETLSVVRVAGLIFTIAGIVLLRHS
jgi:multidrug transporter EmrE-like cation transporter